MQSIERIVCFMLLAAQWPLAVLSFGDGRLLDVSDSANIAKIAKSLCAGNQDQIGRISTVHKLSEFFSKIPTQNHELSKCREKYGNMVEYLDLAMLDSPGGICGRTHVTMMSRFYAAHVSEEHRNTRAAFGLEEAPSMLANIFLRYALEVGQFCHQKFSENAESALERLSHDNEALRPPIEGSGIDVMLKEVESLLQMRRDSVDSIELLKEFAMPLAYDESIENQAGKYFEAIERKPIRKEPNLFLQMKSAKNIRDLQVQCNLKFRPVYKDLIQPLATLVKFGFTGASDQANKKESSKLLRHLFSMTKICETLKQIEFISKPTLDSNQIVVVTREEAAESRHKVDYEFWYLEHNHSKIFYYAPAYELNSIDLLPSVNRGVSGRELRERIRLNTTNERAAKEPEKKNSPNDEATKFKLTDSSGHVGQLLLRLLKAD